MMDFGDGAPRIRMVGDYIIGRKIGSGSFAMVWKSKHRYSGTEFAIKEIDKKHLNDNLRKEISILRNITHPNIIRLFEAIETDERIYLVLEYCDGGDLGAYIHRHGRVSEDIARHFMKQLAAGLQVLREKNLIHRDLKPQNLLLSGREVTPLLKIGDFGFARFLTPQGLADTLCGSPLYMAPEIIQNQRYDAKADLWSVGAICYQLVIGKPPFDGNSQLQLFQNILRSTALQFPEGALQVLHPDFVEFCRSLLRRNPVERLTFEEFFNHTFLMTPRLTVNAETSSLISRVESLDLTDNQGSLYHHDDEMKALEESVKQDCSINDEYREFEEHCSTSGGNNDYDAKPDIPDGKFKHSVEDVPLSLSQTQVAYSLDSIEREYVLVHSNFASTEILTSSLGTSLKEGSATKACALASKNNDKQLPTMPEMNKLTEKVVGDSHNNLQSEVNSSTASGSPCIRDLPILHPSTSLHLIHQYVAALSDLAKEKLNAGFFLESFSVELVILTLWKEALRICNPWLLQSGVPESSSSGNEFAGKKAASSSSNAEGITDFTNPSSVSMWAEKGFIDAYDGTEKLSKYIQDVDGSAEMPDAMEIIFQTAIAAGKNGAADEFVGNRDSAAVLYSKALILFSFIVSEAPSLPLNPPFSLAPDSKQQILKYIKSLEHHLSRSQTSESSVMKLPSFGIKY